jgi:Holliday junction resolvase RusA-like endonuclease
LDFFDSPYEKKYSADFEIFLSMRKILTLIASRIKLLIYAEKKKRKEKKISFMFMKGCLCDAAGYLLHIREVFPK